MTFSRVYLSTLLLLVVALSITCWLLLPLPDVSGPYYFPFTVLVITGFTLFSHFATRTAYGKDGKSFILLVILSMVIRLVVYGIYNFLIIRLNPGNPLSDVVIFGILYLLVTLHEIVFVLRDQAAKDPLKSPEIKK